MVRLTIGALTFLNCLECCVCHRALQMLVVTSLRLFSVLRSDHLGFADAFFVTFLNYLGCCVCLRGFADAFCDKFEFV